VSNSSFGFHPKCLSLRLTHLCFADDLLIFSPATSDSINSIKEVLSEFEELSRLKANPAKSSFFCSGISYEVKKGLLVILQMTEGRLPVRYLGVPLITKKLTAADCEGLLAHFTDGLLVCQEPVFCKEIPADFFGAIQPSGFLV
jgi:hypothetical protein